MGKKAGTKKSGKKSKAKNIKKSKKLHLNINKPPPSPPPSPPSQGQFICIHVGQAGVQVGSACWELFCAEHGINPDGTVHELATDSTSIFSLSQTYAYVPRALFIDSEPSIIDAIKNGNYNKLFPPQNMIYGKENAASNHAAGYYGVDRKITSTVMDQLAHLAEDCNSLQGIALFRSVGGGTGSGMGSRIIENIKTMYPNKTIIDFNIYSSEMVPIILEPYNVALATHHALDTVNCSLLFDNRSLYDICYSKLNLFKPTYKNINSIIALVLSGFTSSLRFSGSMIGTISELLKNLIPQPRLHFPIVSYAPIVNNINSILLASTQLATMSFDYSNQMIKIDPGLGKYLSVCMMFQGDLKPTDINMTIAYIQREQLIPVSQNMSVPLFKFGLCNQSLATISGSGIDVATRAVTTLCNNTSVKHCWISIMKNYNKLLTKRAFLHHYIGEGMDEMEFCLINENISKLIAEYREIENSQ